MKWKSIHIFHPHNPEVVEALIPNVVIHDNFSLVNEVYHDFRPTVMASVDAGGYKSLSKIYGRGDWDVDLVSFSKSRKRYGELTMVAPNIDLENKRILIVDDICIYGGSLLKCIELLPKSAKVAICVSHITARPKEELEKYPIYTCDLRIGPTECPTNIQRLNNKSMLFNL